MVAWAFVMKNKSSVEIVETFWRRVWQPPQDVDSIDTFVTEDFVITSAGIDIVGRQAFKDWVRAFQSKITDLEFDILESFQSEDGTRVASRWRIRGRNNGMFGSTPNQQPLEFTGTAIWEVGHDGKLVHNWVERAAWELFGRLNAAK